MKLVSFVIPCYCSEHTIIPVVDEIRQTMAGLDYDYEIILVNDGSPDDTVSTLTELALSDSHIIAVDLARNFGQQNAIMSGISNSSGDYVVVLDDDGQTPADEVGKLLAKLDEGYDAVYASYEHKQHSRFRNFGSWVNCKMTEILLGKPKNIATTSYFAVKRFIALEMLKYKHCFPYSEGLVLRATKKICNVPVNHRRRQEGESGYNFAKLLSLWMNGFTAFSVKPLRVATYTGSLTALAGLIYALVIIIKHFTDSSIPEGWSSTIAIQLILGGVILLVLGLIGEYIGRIYMCINSSPQFVERQVIKKEQDN
jgi:undecaprenyl-phosphate 4-deoxy-4-formamido-L-arabinose transferase